MTVGTPRALKLAGVALLLVWLAVLAAAVAKVAPCEADCGDHGGRGAFLGLLTATPLAAVGVALLAVGGASRRTRLLGWAVAAGGVLLGVLALLLLLNAADRAAAAITGTDLSGPLTDLEAARSNARTEGIASAVAGFFVATLAAGSLLPLLSGGDSSVARRWTRRLLVLLLLTCLATTLLALATAIQAPLMLPFALLGAAGAGGAALLLARTSVRDTN
jgi:hypothetical protein